MGKIRKIKFIRHTKLANEVHLGIHATYICAKKISRESESAPSSRVVTVIRVS